MSSRNHFENAAYTVQLKFQTSTLNWSNHQLTMVDDVLSLTTKMKTVSWVGPDIMYFAVKNVKRKFQFSHEFQIRKNVTQNSRLDSENWQIYSEDRARRVVDTQQNPYDPNPVTNGHGIPLLGPMNDRETSKRLWNSAITTILYSQMQIELV